ncbi:biotin--[acetyl-CoA-carboxylase] ligase [Shouchella shacheensis]|uniref:biotin--[acetyl-CoA-carboxylase] ligase n=1 Tax=Shouchella shacheensis TaxID=1649580 RepID=UPI0007402D18|nr:biotin--[acetyl-CoA-carboxylase] ligase [Shouchella shacheensis]
MKERLLILLEEGEYVSGEEMSKKLGVSRTAVWKQLTALRDQGYTFESVPKRGYRLTGRPDTIHAHDVGAFLKTERLGRELHYYDTVSSTQTVAHEWANKGAVEGSLVLANEQQGGRGRLGRPWQSKKGTSVSMSLILRPHIEPHRAPQLTLLAAVAITRAIEQETGLRCDIKWPNDILLGGKKLVGILTEMAADPDFVQFVIVGMGVNINQQQEDFTEKIGDIATSLSIEAGRTIQRAALVAAIVNEFEWLYDEYVDHGFVRIRPLWEARSISVNTYLYARTPKEVIYGYSLGITDEGILRLKDENGAEHFVYSADIELDKRT